MNTPLETIVAFISIFIELFYRCSLFEVGKLAKISVHLLRVSLILVVNNKYNLHLPKDGLTVSKSIGLSDFIQKAQFIFVARKEKLGIAV